MEDNLVIIICKSALYVMQLVNVSGLFIVITKSLCSLNDGRVLAVVLNNEK